MKRLTKSTVLAIASLFLFVAVQAVHSEDAKSGSANGKSGSVKKAVKAEAKKADAKKADAKKGEAKKSDTKKSDESQAKVAERQRPLPRFFGDLNLNDEQKAKVRAAQEKYSTKIDDLQKQIDDLKAKLGDETSSVLTADQKKRFEEKVANAKGNRDKSREAVGSRSPLKGKDIGEKIKAAKEKSSTKPAETTTEKK